jgi:hypothetical protein
MATIASTKNANDTFTWETLTASDVGAGIPLPRGGVLMTAHMTGTFGGTVSLQGTVNGTDWFTLVDIQGNPAEFTAAGIAEISTAARAVRPSAGSGVSDVDVFLAISA